MPKSSLSASNSFCALSASLALGSAMPLFHRLHAAWRSWSVARGTLTPLNGAGRGGGSTCARTELPAASERQAPRERCHTFRNRIHTSVGNNRRPARGSGSQRGAGKIVLWVLGAFGATDGRWCGTCVRAAGGDHGAAARRGRVPLGSRAGSPILKAVLDRGGLRGPRRDGLCVLRGILGPTGRGAGRLVVPDCVPRAARRRAAPIRHRRCLSEHLGQDRAPSPARVRS